MNNSLIALLVLLHAVYLVHGQTVPMTHMSKDTLRPKVDTLKPVMVTAAFRPHMKGDTLEYNVENMTMQPNATVEELLRRLPGLKVDFNGNITYNEKKIEHLLVDGEDIFGSSPTMVTRNFDASKIALVQLLDRKSDEAIFTGIDDGSRTKTLNLFLKESAKNGFFGKVEAGGNTDQLYNVNGTLAAFRGKEQFTAAGMTANTGAPSASTDGGISVLQGISDPLGTSAGTGIPTFSAAALHYANTSSGSGDHVAGNYQYSHYFSEPLTSTQTLQTLSDSVYGQNQQSASDNTRDQHYLSASYESPLNSRSGFKFNFRGSNTEEQNRYSASGTSTFNDTLVNSSLRTILDQMSRPSESGSIAYRTAIGRQPGRTFSVTIGMRKTDETTNGYLYSIDRFYGPNSTLQEIDTVDERKQILSHLLNFNGTITLTQSLWKGNSVGVKYGQSYTTDNPLQSTFDKGDGSYTEIIDSLSSHLKTQTNSQYLTVNLQGKMPHFAYTIGTDWLVYNYHQLDLIADSAIQVHFSNLAPKAFFIYTPNQRMNIDFQYSAATQEPSISQLAPVVNNNNPLYITLGNPNLKPGFNQTFMLNIHRFSTWQVNIDMDMALNGNTITTKTTTDSLGRQISQPVNLDGGRSGAMNIFVDRKIGSFDAGFQLTGHYSRALNYINADINVNNAYTTGAGISLNKYVADHYSIQLNTNVGYFNQVSSINQGAPIHYFTQSHSGGLTLWIIPHFEMGTMATYTWQGKTSAFTSNTSVLLWNSYLSRNFLQNKLVVKLQFNNMLNENAGISRTNSANVNTETSTNILGRFWMLSAIYHFDKKFKK